MVSTEIKSVAFFVAEDVEAVYSQQKQDLELTVAQIMNSLLPKRLFTYDLNQISYDYTVAVRNRFNRLDLVDRVPEELCTEVRDTVQEAVIKSIPKKKKCKKAKCKMVV